MGCSVVVDVAGDVVVGGGDVWGSRSRDLKYSQMQAFGLTSPAVAISSSM